MWGWLMTAALGAGDSYQETLDNGLRYYVRRNPRPAMLDVPELLPRKISQLIRVAIPARQGVAQHFGRQHAGGACARWIEQDSLAGTPRPGVADRIDCQVRHLKLCIADAVCCGVGARAGDEAGVCLHPDHAGGTSGQRQAEVAEAAEQVHHRVAGRRFQQFDRQCHGLLVD